MENATARPIAAGLTVIAGLARMAQHLNFAPVGALSLFAGARLRGWRAYALPIVLMGVTDPLLGGYSIATPFVYASFLIGVWMGTKIRDTENPLWIGGMALAGSLQFFLIRTCPAGSGTREIRSQSEWPRFMLHGRDSVLPPHAGIGPAVYCGAFRRARLAEPQRGSSRARGGATGLG